jgi:tripartite-type tricarboxylate transporter receptor subunit TctC
LCAAALAFALPAAMAWSDKPIRMIVPAPAGGTMDVVARIVAEQLSVEAGQPVVVENRAGAGGAIAVQAMLSAPPDGNTIMMTASNILTEIPHVMKTAFDPLKDVKPVTAIARASMVLIGAPNVPAKDVKGVVAWVKANPGKVSFASYSTGTISHYAGMILNQKAGLDMQHVPFAGSPPALAQVMGSQIPLMFDGMATAKKMIEAGKVQVYGIASKKRSPHLPNVPTLAEQGYPELDFSNWVGIIVAAGVPTALVEKINTAVDKAAAAPKVKERLLGAGFDQGGDETAEQMAKSLRADFERNATIVKTFDIKLNQ